MVSLVLALSLHAAPLTQTAPLVLGQKVEVIRGKKKVQPKAEAPAAGEQAKKDQELKDRAAKLDEQQKQLDARAVELKAKEDELAAAKKEEDEKKDEEAKKKAARKKAVESHAKENAASWGGAVDALGD